MTSKGHSTTVRLHSLCGRERTFKRECPSFTSLIIIIKKDEVRKVHFLH